MTQSTKGSFKQRMKGIGGDWAEQAFVDYAAKNNFSIERYGFDRSELRSFAALPEFVRLTPDFVVTHKRQGFLVECKGAGQGDFINIKVRDISGLKFWDEVADLRIFINDSHAHRVALVPFEDIFHAVDHTLRGKWDDGVEFYRIRKAHYAWEDK